MKPFPLLFTFMLMSAPSALASSDVAPTDISYGSPQGWQWYTDPERDEEEDVPPPALPALSASEQKSQLQQKTQEALDTAILYPTPENIRQYRLMQDFWTDKATDFTQGWKKALLLYPELDYNLKHSHYNGTAGAQLAIDREHEKAAISELSQTYGLFFFYRGNDPIDRLFAPVVKGFAEEHQIAIVPIAVDGVTHPVFPRSFKDSGQVARMNIRHFPALYLVNPKAEEYRPLSYGFKSMDDLARSFYNVATDFKPNF